MPSHICSKRQRPLISKSLILPEPCEPGVCNGPTISFHKLSPRSIARALTAATASHTAALLGLLGFGIFAQLGTIYFASLVLVLAALIYEHLLARRGDLAAINKAFFQANAAVSAIFVLSILADRLTSR